MNHYNAFEKMWQDRLAPILGKGDASGHPFRGNQYKGGEGGGDEDGPAKDASAKAEKEKTPEAHRAAAYAHEQEVNRITEATIGRKTTSNEQDAQAFHEGEVLHHNTVADLYAKNPNEKALVDEYVSEAEHQDGRETWRNNYDSKAAVREDFTLYRENLKGPDGSKAKSGRMSAEDKATARAADKAKLDADFARQRAAKK
jgi:hypothetical protein